MLKFEVEEWIYTSKREKVRAMMVKESENDILVLQGPYWRFSINVEKIKKIIPVSIINGYRFECENDMTFSFSKDGRLYGVVGGELEDKGVGEEDKGVGEESSEIGRADEPAGGGI